MDRIRFYFGSPVPACWQAGEIVGHRISFTAPEQETYVVVLINGSETRVDVAVEIGLSLPAILW